MLASTASAQFSRRDPATGEVYKVEFAYGWWRPVPTIDIASEGLGIPPTLIDFEADLGIGKSRVREFRLVLRPARKHKFKIDYLPINYKVEGHILSRAIVFNGQSYVVGLPVNVDADFTTLKLGYEYDFVYKDRGFVGVLLETKYTDITASLTATVLSVTRTEFTHARGPIPAIGVIARGYIVPNISITGEFSGFPEVGTTGSSRYGGKYYDFDMYGTVNFSDHFGAQAGYRSLDVLYKVNKDSGTMKLKGLYFGGVARF